MGKAIEVAFDELEWHDAILLRVVVDRSAPGKNDTVAMTVQWASGSVQTLVFLDCYALEARMNFGVEASESIRTAKCTADSAELVEVRRKWSAVGVELQSLRCFEITTNSTASTIRILALGFSL